SSAYLTYARSFRVGGARVRVGSGRFDAEGSSTSTGLVNLDWSSEIGARSRVGFSLGRELTDAGSQFLFGGPAGGTGSLGGGQGFFDNSAGNVILTSAPLTRSNADITFETSRGDRVSATVAVGAYEEEYEETDNVP